MNNTINIYFLISEFRTTWHWSACRTFDLEGNDALHLIELHSCSC